MILLPTTHAASILVGTMKGKTKSGNSRNHRGPRPSSLRESHHPPTGELGAATLAPKFRLPQAEVARSPWPVVGGAGEAPERKLVPHLQTSSKDVLFPFCRKATSLDLRSIIPIPPLLFPVHFSTSIALESDHSASVGPQIHDSTQSSQIHAGRHMGRKDRSLTLQVCPPRTIRRSLAHLTTRPADANTLLTCSTCTSKISSSVCFVLGCMKQRKPKRITFPITFPSRTPASVMICCFVLGLGDGKRTTFAKPNSCVRHDLVVSFLNLDSH